MCTSLQNPCQYRADGHAANPAGESFRPAANTLFDVVGRNTLADRLFHHEWFQERPACTAGPVESRMMTQINGA